MTMSVTFFLRLYYILPYFAMCFCVLMDSCEGLDNNGWDDWDDDSLGCIPSL